MATLKQYIKFYLNQQQMRRCPYVYDPTRYGGTFLADSALIEETVGGGVAHKIYVFWTGDNPMSDNRLQSIAQLEHQAQVPIVLITPHNLPQYILPHEPLHAAFDDLSLVHKSDYLRCYFMHHYGGGYSDVKACRYSWLPAFKQLEASDAYMIGYREMKPDDLEQLPGTLGKDMKTYYANIIGNGAYISRPDTPITRECYAELMRRMNGYEAALRRHPGNIMGDNPGYPIPWTNILGDIFHPLSLKYHHRILKNSQLRPICKNYR